MLDTRTLLLTGQEVLARAVRRDSAPLNARQDFGARGYGTTDDTAALQAALTAASGRPVVVPSGEYKVTAGLVAAAAGLDLVLDDAVLDFSGVPSGAALITAVGSVAAAVNVNAVMTGASQITGAPGIETGIVAGDVLKLRSADVFDPGRDGGLHGELVVVASTAPGQVNLRSPVMGAYSTSVQIRKTTMTGLRLSGSGQITGGGSGSTHLGVVAKQAVALRIGGSIHFRAVENVAVQLWDCLDFDVSGVDFDGSTSPQGYGISVVNCCQWGRVHHNHLRNCRHATSVNHNKNVDGGGIPRHVAFEDNEVRDTTADAMDSHAGAEYISWERNHIYDAGFAGINVECPKATVKNNRIYRPADSGVLLLNAAAQSAELRVTGNEVHDSPEYGIRFVGFNGAGASAPVLLDVLDNELIRCAKGAVYADSSDQTTSPYTVRAARVLRNLAHACSAAGTVATFYLRGGGELCDNKAMEQPAGVGGSRVFDMQGGRYCNNIVRFASPATTRAHRGFSVVDSEVAGNIALNASGTGGVGLELDANSTGCRVHDNDTRGATTPYTIAGSGHVMRDNRPPAGDINVNNVNGGFLLTPHVSPEITLYTATITADRSCSLSTTGAQKGMRFRIVRTGAGAFNLNVGVGPLIALAQNEWCEVVYDGSAWTLCGAGALA